MKLRPDARPGQALSTVLAAALLSALAAAAGGCSAEPEPAPQQQQQQPPPQCQPGSDGCACADGASCDEGLACNEGTCSQPGCTAGTIGCACLATGGCVSDKAKCEAGRCVLPTCPLGQEGCPCTADGRCGYNSRAEKLSCEAGVCTASSCAPGSSGCACRDGACSVPTDACQSGFCRPSSCVPGELNCACAGGGCGPGLICREDTICVDGTGYIGGACFAGDSCRRGGRCQGGTCIACVIGTRGCACDAGQGCAAPLSCVQETCTEVVQPPETASCYTRCASDLVNASTGEFRACPADKLMAGCLGAEQCVDGSCVRPSVPVPACAKDQDCLEHQTCIQAKCYSTCSRDADCSGSKRCYLRVCRAPCETGGAACPLGSSCRSDDGVHGFCMPLTASGAAVELPPAKVDVDKTALDFTGTSAPARITITNDGVLPESVVVRKLRHHRYFEDGTVERREDLKTGAAGYKPCDPVAGTCPLTWLTLKGQAVQELTLDIGAGNRELVDIAVQETQGSRWEGVIEIRSRAGTRQVVVRRVKQPKGRWTGNVYYFAQFGTNLLDVWRADQASRNDSTKAGNVGNAFIQQWASFRRGDLSLDDVFAMIQSTQVRSWEWPTVKAGCTSAACYPIATGTGVAPFSTNLKQYPVPSGVTEMPFAVNLYRPDASAQPGRMIGKIDSSYALQFPNEPKFTLDFTKDPSQCERANGPCMVFLTDPAPGAQAVLSKVLVSGHYETTASDTTCGGRADGSYLQVKTPWLLPDFVRGTELDVNGQRFRYGCNDKLRAAPGASAELNASLAAANPIPNGQTRVRTLKLVDGALINQSQLLIIFEEQTSSFLSADVRPLSAYGFIALKRESIELDETADADTDQIPDVYDGNDPAAPAGEPTDLLKATCSKRLLEEVLGYGTTTIADADDARAMVTALIDGVDTSSTPFIDPSAERAHWLCVQTGRFDAGPVGEEECPASSQIIFFTTPSTTDDAALRAHDCQARGQPQGTCDDTLQQWKDQRDARLKQHEPVWRCADPNKVFCSSNRLDLRAEKQFYAVPVGKRVYAPLYSEIEQAFRYKTRFVSRTASTVGFAPQVCIPNSNQIPYCYDPAVIEQVAERVDCLAAIWRDHHALLGTLPAATQLDNFLCHNFSYKEACEEAPSAGHHDGFERLFAELLVMMGDESYTRAFASRFDLAGGSTRSFDGPLFELGMTRLSGPTGYEMFSLYQAIQYYQEAMDRFYRLAPLIVAALGRSSAENFVEPETVTWYLDRLVRASTQKSRAWSQVALRYQNFNRPDLARRVIERAYSATYLESVVLAQLMLRISTGLNVSDFSDVLRTLDEGQGRWRMAMLDMARVHKSISDNINYFGIPPDYIPFPALNNDTENAFETLVQRALSKAAVARERENDALTRSKSFDSDAQEFQAELVRVRNNYEAQLGGLCGTFQASDGRVYPAIERYAHLDERAAKLGDPCGLMGVGDIATELGELEVLQLDMKKVLVSSDQVLSRIEIERERASAACNEVLELANYKYDHQGQVNDLQADIRDLQFVNNRIEKGIGILGTAFGMHERPWLAVGYAAAAVAADVAVSIMEKQIEQKQETIESLERSAAKWETEHECDTITVNAEADMKSKALELNELALDALRAEYKLRLGLSDLERKRLEAKRLQQEMAESEQMLINTQAARNDPNVRIYKNDAYMNADITFDDALREAYRATRVFEYYTSQSYARREQLFSIRLVQFGDYNLDNYLADLQNAFFEFEETYGLPDTRVAVLSLRDDILQLTSGTLAERTGKLRKALEDASRLDENGYLTLPFATRLEELSPVTRNHKILYVEANIQGDTGGDSVARLYLRQRGTSVVRGVGGDKLYYRFPERLAVLNPFFNGNRRYDAQVYRNNRLRDRPFVNTGWDLVINRRDEPVNSDLNLQGIDDIQLFVYYTDFTQL